MADDRVIIITGGGGGIGREYALHFGGLGAGVALADIAGEKAEQVAKEVTDAGGQALAVETDVSEEASVQRMVERVLERFGKITGLVNNHVFTKQTPWDQVPVDLFYRILGVNVIGSYLTARAVVPSMREQGKGHIVNIASGHFFHPGPNVVPYAASKGGIVGLTRALAGELGASGINVNCVAPSLTRTERAMQVHGDEDYDRRAQERYIKRWMYPADLVGAVDFLLSDASSFITGQLLNVDGGVNLH